MEKMEISKVHDAYRLGGECPLCTLMDAAERTYLLSFQGSRVMEPNVRVQTNRVGFCREHYGKLYRGENKLGLGLVVHTHLQTMLPELSARMEAAIPAEAQGRSRRDRQPTVERFEALEGFLNDLTKSCFICGILSSDLDRYVFTIVYLMKNDAAFIDVFRGSRGFCVHHLAPVIEKAREMLKPDERERFLKELVPLEKASLEGLERDLFNFTQLFHDANRSLGSEEERTALVRTLQKLAGFLVGKE